MSLFREIGMHAGLGRTLSQIGTERFWKQLVLLLHQCLPFDNALAIFYPLEGPPQALEEYDAQPSSKPASMLVYLNGLYLLDPFFQACREGYPSGVYRLEE
ncbi:helix-turn-helix transcriptional regulator, partial [Corynebacterium pseudodiphtheriticum]